MKLFLAGYEAISYVELFEERSDFILGSFHYLRKSKKDYLEAYINEVKYKCKDFILDSGAFSMLKANKSLESFIGDLDGYVENYINFINEHNIKNYIELDIDSLIGYEKVKEIRKRLEEGTGRKCIPVWHLSRGIDDFIKCTKEYNYIAIGGIVIKEIKPKDYPRIFPKLLRIAKKNNCKVHGLGFTRTKDLKKYNFYSVDSTSWSSCVRYARIFEFDVNKKELKSRVISKNYKLDQKGKKFTKLLKISLKEWMKYQKYLQGGKK